MHTTQLAIHSNICWPSMQGISSLWNNYRAIRYTTTATIHLLAVTCRSRAGPAWYDARCDAVHWLVVELGQLAWLVPLFLFKEFWGFVSDYFVQTMVLKPHKNYLRLLLWLLRFRKNIWSLDLGSFWAEKIFKAQNRTSCPQKKYLKLKPMLHGLKNIFQTQNRPFCPQKKYIWGSERASLTQKKYLRHWLRLFGLRNNIWGSD